MKLTTKCMDRQSQPQCSALRLLIGPPFMCFTATIHWWLLPACPISNLVIRSKTFLLSPSLAKIPCTTLPELSQPSPPLSCKSVYFISHSSCAAGVDPRRRGGGSGGVFVKLSLRGATTKLGRERCGSVGIDTSSGGWVQPERCALCCMTNINTVTTA